MRKEIIFIGAGAIGRGYLPWVFQKDLYDFIFIDSNPSIVQRMNQNKQSTSIMTKNGTNEKLVYKIKKSYTIEEFNLNFHPNPLAIFVQVGPRKCLQALESVKEADCPIILCENDSDLVNRARDLYSKKNIYFGIPDVITSSTAPSHLLKEDPLTIVTENGVLFIDENARVNGFQGNIQFISNKELINKQWKAKLYIHNTPHCIAAYLGALLGKTYLHEAMEIGEINKIVEGVMFEMLNTLKLKWDIEHDFLDWYAGKELSRFRNKLLFDPVTRVAREPLRKLEINGRLIGAANICLAQGFFPENIFKGIIAAILFKNEKDCDHQLSLIRDALSPTLLLTFILGLRKGEALEIALSEQFSRIKTELIDIIDKYK